MRLKVAHDSAMIALAAALVASLAPATTHAHGPSIGVVQTPADGVVWLTTGAAIRGSDGTWTFLCPSAWGGPQEPPVAVSDDGVWILGQDGFMLWKDGFERVLDRDVAEVLDVTSWRGEAWVLTHADETTTSTLESLDSGRVIPLTRPWTTVSGTPTGFVVARLDEGALELAWVEDGDAPSDTEIERYELASPVLDVDLRRDVVGEGAELFAALSGSEAHELVRLEPAALESLSIDRSEESGLVASVGRVRSSAPINGPVRWDDALLFASGGALLHWQGEGIDSVLGASRFACVDEGGAEGALACTAFTVVELSGGPGAWASTEAFRINQLEAPRDEDIPADQREVCEAEWFDFALHSGILPFNPGEKPQFDTEEPVGPEPEPEEMDEEDDTESEPEGGCGSVRARPADWLLVVLVMGLVWVRRRRVYALSKDETTSTSVVGL